MRYVANIKMYLRSLIRLINQGRGQDINRYAIQKEFTNFILDMKIMYNWIGKTFVKEVLKTMLAITALFVFFYLAKIPMYDANYVLFIIPIAMLAGYFIVYFSTYRADFRRERKGEELKIRYRGLYDKFNKSQ